MFWDLLTQAHNALLAADTPKAIELTKQAAEIFSIKTDHSVKDARKLWESVFWAEDRHGIDMEVEE
jgi:hypothetical protein